MFKLIFFKRTFSHVFRTLYYALDIIFSLNLNHFVWPTYTSSSWRRDYFVKKKEKRKKHWSTWQWLPSWRSRSAKILFLMIPNHCAGDRNKSTFAGYNVLLSIWIVSPCNVTIACAHDMNFRCVLGKDSIYQ